MPHTSPDASSDGDARRARTRAGLGSPRVSDGAPGNASRPDARGVFSAQRGSVWAWINQEEHLQLFATHEGDRPAPRRQQHSSLRRG